MTVRLLALTCAFAGVFVAASAHAVEPHRSERYLPSSNGRAAIAYDAEGARLTQFLEHPFASLHTGSTTRNFLFDSYPGVRIGAAGTWLTGVPPTIVEYLPGTGIVHTLRIYSGLNIDEYDFAPMGLAEYASVMLVRVTRTSGSGAVDAYALENYHLGSGGPQPGTDGEQIYYDAAQDAYYESGPSGVAFAYLSIAASTHHGATPNNPFDSLNAGANLADDPGTSGPTNDAVAGFQQSLGNLASGQSAWSGWVTVLAPDAAAQAAATRVRSWLAQRTSDKVLSDESAAWSSWVTPPAQGVTSFEAKLSLASQAMLRMGQVTEDGGGKGQILAAIAPGQWNISWVRDMAYAVVGLVKSGHYAEANAALSFQMGATTGAYQKYVGGPYQISVVRYTGDGTEESDSNQNGPNIEFDGFGLFLWSLDEYVRASGDVASLNAWWPIVTAKVADALVNLQEPTGLIAPDSSIWEVHWNGQQRHFGYTTITAANGFCAAGRLADKAGDALNGTKYRAAGGKARDALLTLRAPDGTIAQSVEALAGGVNWLDASEVEAINFGLVDPTRRTARSTLASMQAGLVPPSGRGFMRDDIGQWYDSQEWVFVDLRAARALELHGASAASASLLAWNVGQASENFGVLSELHDATTADYAGASPMVGFGAGAYLTALADRGSTGAPGCGIYASEPADPVDAGPEGGVDGGAIDGAVRFDGSVDSGGGGEGGGNGVAPAGASGGCGCGVATTPIRWQPLLVFSMILATALRRRRPA